MHTYSWNERGQLATIDSGSTAVFGYDGFGRRVSTSTFGAAAINYLYDEFNSVQQSSNTTPIANLITGGLDEYFTRSDTAGTLNLLADAWGSTHALTDGTGTVQTQYGYEPFGNTTPTGSSTNTFQYTGRENDNTGLYFLRARYYKPTIGRFISEDPIGFYGGQTDLYSYVGNSPTNFFDPFGMDKKGLFSCAAENAEKASPAALLHGLGVPDSGVAGFVTDALGGNAFSGATDLVQSFGSGEAGGHSVYYHMGQGVVAGPTLGFGAAFGQRLEGTPWASGPADIATGVIANGAQRAITGYGQTIQTLNGEAELGTVLGGEAAEWGSGVGEARLAYDAATWLGSLAGCGTGLLN